MVSMACDFLVTNLRDGSTLVGQDELLRKAAAADGYLYLPGLIESGAVEQLRSKVLLLCAEFGWLNPNDPINAAIPAPGVSIDVYDDPWVELQQRVAVMDEFVDIGHSPAILEVMAVLIPGTLVPGCGNTWRLMSPHAPQYTTPPHQDAFYIKDARHLWTAWLPLGNCPKELGGLAVAPGSHRFGLREHRDGSGGAVINDESNLDWATTNYAAGDVLLFSGLTVHRGLHNRGPQLRISADFRYQSEQD